MLIPVWIIFLILWLIFNAPWLLWVAIALFGFNVVMAVVSLFS